MAEIILAAGLFVFVAHLLELIFEKTRIPDILLMMVIGVIAGPAVTGLVNLAAFGRVGEFLSSVTLVVILTESGISLNIRTLLAQAGRAVPFALISMAGAVAGMAWVFAELVGLDMWTAILGAFILGGTSSAVVIPMVKGLKASDETTTILTIESALTDVLCIIGTVGITAALAQGAGVVPGSLVGNAAYSLVGASVLGLAMGFVWALILSIFERMKNAMFTTLAFALVIYGFAETLGLSGAIAALAFGITLGNLPDSASLRVGKRSDGTERNIRIRNVNRTERKLYAQVVFLLKSFFFFYLGLNVTLDAFATGLGVAALVLALVPFIPRIPAVLLFMSSKTTNRREALLSWALVPRGLAAAVLAQLPIQAGLEHAPALASTVAMMVFISILLVAIFVFLIERGILDSFGRVVLFRFPQDVGKPTNSVEEATDSEPAAYKEPEGQDEAAQVGEPE